jgi:hypothetical protein
MRRTRIENHVSMIEERGKKEVRILCLQRAFDGPCFSVEQNPTGTIGWRKYPTDAMMHGPAKKYSMDKRLVADLHANMIEEVRRVWQFFKDRRPDAHHDLCARIP